ncbi:uncharacterized protein K489DRAFT_370431 [Dissoconium aciculare CBS 342.82]|uniref:DUF4048 domain-containing protein n=1 Tax=Dissoconium aciculare CBS 342.82 TaxID=1314786 RepID=A0A6J3M449_9PEZI|nr:uncharacterized protein K489DRAFT_370431 [Dissoconium aciculare CBS 342.82]KAF1822811.1 hypothetical protein K489DRAFT_370431 [Dissoconium aciculare CBS 342.82]
MNSELYNADFLASPVEMVDTTLSAGRRSLQSHSRTMSAAADFSSTTKRSRNSVHFPMQLTALREQPVAFPTNRDVNSTGTTTTGCFLTALAAQERKVLELREDLHRAEVDLSRLKKQWARHEEIKKKRLDEAPAASSPDAPATPLVALDDMETSDASVRAQKALERRKALLQANKPSNRTVFSGSRHTRKLSLLATNVDLSKLSLQPTTSTEISPDESPGSSDASKVSSDTVSPREQPGPLSPGIDLGINLLDHAIDHELFIRTGKKFAADFKDGLITFWEDIRQATVGEEATQPTIPRKGSTQTLRAPRKQGSKNNLQSSSRSSLASPTSSTDTKRPSPGNKSSALPDLADTTFWAENLPENAPTITSVTPSAQNAASPSSPQAVTEEDDSWETWNDSPRQSRHSSDMASETNTAPSTVSASPRTSTSTNPDSSEFIDKDLIPWPVLSKLGPGALQRTASTLMREWEKSLSPTTTEDNDDKTGDLKKD